jgi:hypothetical protein
MARKIPGYKKVILVQPGQEPQLPPSLVESQKMQLAHESAQREALPTGVGASSQASPVPLDRKMSPKILTTMEIRSRIIGMMNERNYDPVRELIKIAANNTTDERTRIEIHKELIQYIAPKLKSTDLQLSGDLQLTVNVVKFSTGGGQLAPNREAIPVRAVEVAS